MSMYIIGLALLKAKLHMLQDDLDQGSKSVYLEAMEAIICFQKDFIKEYMNTISHYQECH